MKTQFLFWSIGLFLVGSALADPAVPAKHSAVTKKSEEKLVFVTGSLIPQRVQLRATGTATVSPVRIIDRSEIDRAGRATTAGAFATEPAVTIVGR